MITLCMAGFTFGQTSSLSIETGPRLSFPLGQWSSELISTGFGGEIGLSYDPGEIAGLLLRGGLRYEHSSVQSITSLSFIGADAGAGWQFQLSPRFGLKALAGGGYSYGILEDDSFSGGQLSAFGGLGGNFLVSPSLDLELIATYRAELGLAHLLDVWIGARYYFSGTNQRRRTIEAARSSDGLQTPPPGKGLRIENLELDEIFPVFYTYYDDHPIGSMELYNPGTDPIVYPKISLYIPQFMETPREVDLPDGIEGGRRIPLDLTALFNDDILSVTEATKVSGQLKIEYTIANRQYGESREISIRILDRNAITWNDDRRAAAFVTAKDPAIMAISKHAAGAVRNVGPDALDKNMVTAMGLFSVLDILDTNYVVDPQNSYKEFSRNITAVDYLQFPRQTLEYRAGDCDDLSVLYAAMLESVGVETAFITVPGHIYLAFRAAYTPRELGRILSSQQELIVIDNVAWFPVEVTIPEKGFMEAWETGAREWRDASESGSAKLIPVHDTWSVYEPVALPGSIEIAAPAASEVLNAFRRELSEYVDREMGPRVQSLLARINNRGESPQLINALGVLYARYGHMDQAIEQFNRAVSQSDYAPAVINLGNLASLEDDWEVAVDYYSRAAKMRPDNSAVLLGLARAYFELGQYGMARSAYELLDDADPILAGQYAYLNGADDSAARAAAAGRDNRTVLWAEED